MKRIIIPLLAVIVLAVGIGSTYAYFTRTLDKDNSMTTGYCDIRISETGSIPETVPSEEAFTITDTVSAENTGSISCFIRAAIDFDSSDSEVASTVNGMDPRWVYTDGFYYYSPAVKSGEFTAPLLTSIDVDTLDKDIARTYKIGIYMEAIDCGGQDDCYTAWSEYMNGN